MKEHLDAIAKIKYDPLPDDAGLETILRNEINFLERKLEAHANVADRYRMMANAYKDKLRAAGLKA